MTEEAGVFIRLNARIRELLGSNLGLEPKIHQRLRMRGLLPLCLLNSFIVWCLVTGTWVYKNCGSFCYDVITAYVPIFPEL
jgi:hypothetical protein